MLPKPLGRFCGLLASAITVAVLVGCSGSSGSQGPAGAPGAPAPVAGYARDAAAMSRTEWVNLNPKGVITSASVNAAGQPVVNFTLTDRDGNAVKGIGAFDQLKPGQIRHTYPNFYFEVAKLVPPAAGTTAPSKWVSYIVNTVATVANVSKPQAPNSDLTGDLVDHGDGTYTYTFDHSISQAKAQLDAYVVAHPGTDVSDLGDVSYQPSLTHRISMEFYGNARGTGSGSHANTADGSTGTAAAYEIENAINVQYDFIPATGAKVSATDTSREIVMLSTCQTCHTVLKYHGDHRVDPQNCVTCHTDQRKFGETESVKELTGTTWSFATDSNGLRVNNTSELDFPQLIHQIHKGEGLSVTGYELKVDSNVVAFGNAMAVNAIRYPQSYANCDTCHVTNAAAPKAGNWKTVPSREACGACHDTTQFLLGINHIPARTFAVTDDNTCAQCHFPDDLAVAHTPVVAPDPTNGGKVAGGNTHTNTSYVAGNYDNLPAGAVKINYEIQSVSLNADRQPVWVFRVLANGAPITTINTFVAGTTQEMFPNFVGGPNLYFAYAVPMDGITAPNDFNTSVSVNLHKLWRGGVYGSVSQPDAAGWITAIYTGSDVPPAAITAAKTVRIPDNATLMNGGVGYFYGVVALGFTPGAAANTDTLPLTQTNVAGFTYDPATYQGGLSVAAPNVYKAVSSDSVRRPIVANDRCNACHKNLGVFTEAVFHAGQRNDAPSCTFCHNVNGVDSGWTYNIKEAVHSLHASSMRATPYSWEAVGAYWDIAYPAKLNNCEACHLPGTYDMSASASAAALNNNQLLWSTVASGNLPIAYNSGVLNAATPVVTAQVLGIGSTTLGTYANNAIPAGTNSNQAMSPFLFPGQARTAYALGDFTNVLSVTTVATAKNTDFTTHSAMFGTGLVVNATAGNAKVTTMANAKNSYVNGIVIATPITTTLAAGKTYEPEGTTLVNSPITSACYACHDSNTARLHMESNGGKLNVTRIDAGATSVGGVLVTPLVNKEQCMVCHGVGKTADVGAVHMNF